MRTDESPLLARWRRAEDAYVEACRPLLDSVDGRPAFSKDHLIALVALRHAADAARERYYLAGQEADNPD